MKHLLNPSATRDDHALEVIKVSMYAANIACSYAYERDFDFANWSAVQAIQTLLYLTGLCAIDAVADLDGYMDIANKMLAV